VFGALDNFLSEEEKMNVLLLIVTGPRFDLFRALARKLVADGHSVLFAADCRFSIEFNRLETTGCGVVNFEEFFKNLDQAGWAGGATTPYDCENLNGGLLSDYERDMCYNRLADDPRHYVRLKEALVVFFERLLREKQIDVVIYEGISNAFAYFCNVVCQKHGIKYLGLQNARVPGRFVIVRERVGYIPGFAGAVNEILEGRRVVSDAIRVWAQSYLAEHVGTKPDYMQTNMLGMVSLRGRYLKREKFEKARLVLKHAFGSHLYSAWRGNPLYFSYRQVLRNVCRRVKHRALKRYYMPPQVDRPYLLYPLHFHPEASTSMLAGAYLNEYEVIRNIAFSLPERYMLFVKDHISACGYPSLKFYRGIAKLPNVCLLSATEDTKQLIRHSAAIITLSSTVGFEGLLMNKRVFLFGRVFYDFHPNVVKIRNPGELYTILKAGLEEPLKAGSLYNEAFLAGYMLQSEFGELKFWGCDSEMEEMAACVYPAIMKASEERNGTSDMELSR
jgi:hypothetical protein